MSKGKPRMFVGDFETTVYEGQTDTEVWASASVEIGTEDVNVFHSITDQFNYFVGLHTNIICYYHNLKFDGAFWLSFLINDLGFKQALVKVGPGEFDFAWDEDANMDNDSFKYMVSSMGQWYSITIKTHGRFIRLRDSLKLLPFSVKSIGKAFKTTHQKLDMEYKGRRYAGCTITDDEKKYIANDVLVVKEALEIMFAQGHNKLTIGACCLDEFKKEYQRHEYQTLFPNLFDAALDDAIYGCDNIGDYIRHAYKGGWCYLVKGKECKRYTNGVTADVNSLYPSMMHSESGNYYPVGSPYFFKGEIPDVAKKPEHFYFVRLRTRFYIKEGKLPFIQIKGDPKYDGTVALETSDVYDKKTGTYLRYYTDPLGVIRDTRVTLTLTMMDYQLLLEQYNLEDCEILDGCWFYSMKGIFDAYINKYKKIKMESKGALRTLAKLFLNNLYGKMASNENSSFKVAFAKEDESLGFIPITEYDKTPGYIPIGAAITSYARNFTIRAAQANFHGVDKPGFIYADTDSIHCDLKPEEVVGIKVHPSNFCCWKLESSWDIGWFVRQKTYIEHVVAEDLEPIEEPYYNVKAAGCPEKCKNLFISSLNGTIPEGELSDSELDFVRKKRNLEDFDLGLSIPGKLLPKRIKGGIILEDTNFTMQ